MRTLIVFALLLGLSLSLHAASNNELFTKGNDFYKKGAYGHAIESYEAILKTGVESSELYFNLANAYFKAGITAASVLNYERALRLDPGNEDIRFNLEMANHRVVDKIETLPEFFLSVWIDKIASLFTFDTWAYISAAAFSLFLAFLILFLFSVRMGIKRMSFFIGLVALIISVKCLWLSNHQYNKSKNISAAIIYSPTVTVKGSPDPQSTDLFLLHEGSRIQLIDSVGTWREVKIADGRKGWIEESNFKII